MAGSRSAGMGLPEKVCSKRRTRSSAGISAVLACATGQRRLALQYATMNIQVNAICPGFFVTKLGPYDDSEFSRLTTEFTPMKRLAQPSEMKGTALYLACSASSFVTGACIVIDGGCMAK